jgi:hypothetical protein
MASKSTGSAAAVVVTFPDGFGGEGGGGQKIGDNIFQTGQIQNICTWNSESQVVLLSWQKMGAEMRDKAVKSGL